MYYLKQPPRVPTLSASVAVPACLSPTTPGAASALETFIQAPILLGAWAS